MVVEAFLPSAVLIGALVKIFRQHRILLFGNRRSHTFYRADRPVLSFLDGWATSVCDALICNSYSVQVEALKQGEISGEKIFVVRNGIEIETQVLNFQIMREPKIVYVSNHHEYKRTITLLEALLRLKGKSDIKTLIFGSGVETTSLKTFVKGSN